MAVWYRFAKDFDYDVRAREGALALKTVAYKGGAEEFVPEAHAAAADEAGVGERFTKDAAADEGEAGNGRRRKPS